MKKDDFWFFSLIALSLAGVVTKWSFWSCLAVIVNSSLVLWNSLSQILKFKKERRSQKDGR